MLRTGFEIDSLKIQMRFFYGEMLFLFLFLVVKFLLRIIEFAFWMILDVNYFFIVVFLESLILKMLFKVFLITVNHLARIKKNFIINLINLFFVPIFNFKNLITNFDNLFSSIWDYLVEFFQIVFNLDAITI